MPNHATCALHLSEFNPMSTTSTFSAADAEAFAAALLAARQPGARRAITPVKVPETDADAYKVQDIIRAKLGPTEGWKVGAANPTSEPNCAPVLRGGFIDASRGGIPLSIPVPKPTAIETEIAFRMAKAFPASTKAPTAAEVLAGIGSAHIAMELCAHRLADGMKAPPKALLADSSMQLGFLIGPEVKDWRKVDAHKAVARAWVDNKIAVETTAGHTQKDLAALLVWLVGHVVTKRGGLNAGSVIATGSWTGAHWIDHAANVAAEFPGVGRLEARLAM
jgi:2-keto-4-pentenoate hydratase